MKRHRRGFIALAALAAISCLSGLQAAPEQLPPPREVSSAQLIDDAGLPLEAPEPRASNISRETPEPLEAPPRVRLASPEFELVSPDPLPTSAPHGTVLPPPLLRSARAATGSEAGEARAPLPALCGEVEAAPTRSREPEAGSLVAAGSSGAISK